MLLWPIYHDAIEFYHITVVFVHSPWTLIQCTDMSPTIFDGMTPTMSIEVIHVHMQRLITTPVPVYKILPYCVICPLSILQQKSSTYTKPYVTLHSCTDYELYSSKHSLVLSRWFNLWLLKLSHCMHTYTLHITYISVHVQVCQLVYICSQDTHITL